MYKTKQYTQELTFMKTLAWSSWIVVSRVSVIGQNKTCKDFRDNSGPTSSYL